ncbi:MAG: phosphoribosylformylglycinamidine synthase subunit PurQ, partial [Limisphaerales bacterium]
VFLRTANHATPFTRALPAGKILRLPIAHGDGCYFADADALARLEANGQILWQYATPAGEITDDANPNGSLRNIAGVCNEARNVAGLMPHPERACEAILGGEDGRGIFEGMIAALRERRLPQAA